MSASGVGDDYHPLLDHSFCKITKERSFSLRDVPSSTSPELKAHGSARRAGGLGARPG